MKTVRIGEKNYTVLVAEPKVAWRPTKSPGKGEQVAICSVSIYSDDMTYEGSGISVCSPQDKFSGKLGIQQALRRALKKVRVPDPTPISAGRRAPRPLTSEEKAPFYRLFGWGTEK